MNNGRSINKKQLTSEDFSDANDFIKKSFGIAPIIDIQKGGKKPIGYVSPDGKWRKISETQWEPIKCGKKIAPTHQIAPVISQPTTPIITQHVSEKSLPELEKELEDLLTMFREAGSSDRVNGQYGAIKDLRIKIANLKSTQKDINGNVDDENSVRDKRMFPQNEESKIPEGKREATDLEKQSFRFLNSVREGGKINMFGAGPYLQEMILDGVVENPRQEARKIMGLWMKNFSDEGNYDYIKD